MTTTSNDPLDLTRFTKAQEPLYTRVLSELRAGQKRTHWMWYIFPQINGLGHSSTAVHYAIKSRNEAQAYLSHPVLGARLRECTDAVLAVEGRTASQIFGFPDDLKFKSSLTLFASVDSPDSVFHHALDKYFAGKLDEKTLQILENLTGEDR